MINNIQDYKVSINDFETFGSLCQSHLLVLWIGSVDNVYVDLPSSIPFVSLLIAPPVSVSSISIGISFIMIYNNPFISTEPDSS